MKDYGKFCSFLDESKKQLKSLEESKRLSLLDSFADKFAAKTLKEIFKAGLVGKTHISFTGYINDNGLFLDHSNYGHLFVDDKQIRLSSCLDKITGTLQVPCYETEHWNDKSYIFFTTGDLFILVKTSDIEGLEMYASERNNFVYGIPDLFLRNAITEFGIVRGSTVELPDRSFQLSSIKLPQKFAAYKLRGCRSSFNPKYALIRKNSRTLDGELYCTIKSIIAHYNLSYSQQYLSRLSHQHTQIFQADLGLSDCRKNMPSIKIGKQEFLLINLREVGVSEIQKVYKSCEMHHTKELEEIKLRESEPCKIRQAVRVIEPKVRSSEEFEYYKSVVERWQNDLCSEPITITKTRELKELNQYKRFRYKPNGTYHLYKRRTP